MRTPSEWPPPLDAVHVFSVSIGDEKLPLALAQVPPPKAAAILALWDVGYAQLQPRNLVDQMLAGARQQVDSSVTSFGAYLDGVDGDESAIARVRFERDSSGIRQDTMILDAVLCSPSMPQQLLGSVHSATVQALYAIGEAHRMNVRSWKEDSGRTINDAAYSLLWELNEDGFYRVRTVHAPAEKRSTAHLKMGNGETFCTRSADIQLRTRPSILPYTPCPCLPGRLTLIDVPHASLRSGKRRRPGCYCRKTARDYHFVKEFLSWIL